MQLTVTTATGVVFPVDVAEDMELENLLALCQTEVVEWTSVPLNNFTLIHNGNTYNRNGDMLKRTLKELNIGDNDMVLISARSSVSSPPRATNNPQQRQQRQQHQQTPSNTLNSMLAGLVSSIRVPVSGSSSSSSSSSSSKLAQLFRQAQNDAQLRIQLEHSNPPLHDALVKNDFEAFQRIASEQMNERLEHERARLRAHTADPSDPEAQRWIEQQIEQENIRHQLETAMEHMPESFASVHMLYIACQINGHPVKAFVDSGAQRTIMSQHCAERCHVMRLVDKRFNGVASGVGGSQKILGRIHMAQVQIDKEYLAMSFDVLQDQSMDVLLGLDMLKRHQCLISLRDNTLHIGDHTTVTFLSENELPAHARLNNSNLDEASASGASLVTEEAVRQLVAMGFDANAARIELAKTFGDVAAAAARLSRGDQPSPGQ